MTGYTITQRPGKRWYDFPYKVRRDGSPVGDAMTLRGARYLIRKDKRDRAAGGRTVYSEDAS